MEGFTPRNFFQQFENGPLTRGQDQVPVPTSPTVVRQAPDGARPPAFRRMAGFRRH